MGRCHVVLLHECNRLGIGGDHVVNQCTAYVQLEFANLDTKAFRAPPRLESFLGGPKPPQVIHGTFITAFNAHRWLTRHCHFLSFWLVVFPKPHRSASTAP